ncbi:MAG TPA: tRNA pseudouridine(55) synthase TruB, partial [Xanthomonadales bacterium]|nr:tRNA pseudouridine(55) synthase TruB [Xanthomonadales bacterium]
MHGILLLDKPFGLSSNQALSRAKRLLGVKKAGHTGSLDPLATGMLPLCFGEATKVAGLLLGNRKRYEAHVKLGSTTTTADAEGEVTATHPVPALGDAELAALLARFTGTIRQRPPAYSALKRDGVPLYKLARRGEDVVAPEREVHVESIELVARTHDTLDLRVTCGTGTYIRSIATDLGAAIGCGAHLGGLRRSWVEPFEAQPMVSLEALETAAAAGRAADVVLPIDSALQDWPRADLDPVESARLRHGHAQPRPLEAWTGRCRLYDDLGRLAALGERSGDGL